MATSRDRRIRASYLQSDEIHGLITKTLPSQSSVKRFHMHEYYTDPADPSAPPRQRVTPVDGSKGGFFHRVFGGKDVVWRERVSLFLHCKQP